MGYREWKERIRQYQEITEYGPIVRRYFVLGAFDGTLTILGILLGAFFAGASKAQISVIVAAGLSALVALAISSIVGAYEAERVEKKLDQKRVEKALLAKVGNEHQEAYRFATRISAVIHGISPLVAGLIPIIPLYIIPLFNWAILTSAVVSLSLLFVIGWYLGSLVKERAVFTGLRFVLAALATAAIIVLIGQGV
ncbi:MAG: VIT1/CCC1 transporter family protein [Methanobacteriota archaeon]|nr:MAG: VIT1/CCC1 transporter family protein [Euryarchaeota archaeon]